MVDLEEIAKRAKELAEEDGEMWHFLSAVERNNYYAKASHELAPDIAIN